MDIRQLYDTSPWEWPEDAADTISKVLSDKNAPEEERMLAAELAGDNVVMNDEMAAFLLAFVKKTDEPEELRARAAVSFGAGIEFADIMEFDEDDDCISEEVYNEIQENFRTLYYEAGTPKILRRRILEGAVRGPMDWHGDALRDAYANKDTEWQMTAIFCMGYVKGFEKEVSKALESEDEDIFREAVRASGRLGIKEAWPYVKKILYDKHADKWLLIAAIEAAATVNPEESEEILLKYADSKDEDIAIVAEESLTDATIAADDEIDDVELYGVDIFDDKP